MLPLTTLSMSGPPIEPSFVKNFFKKCHYLVFGCCILFQAFCFCTKLKTLEKAFFYLTAKTDNWLYIYIKKSNGSSTRHVIGMVRLKALFKTETQ